MAVIALLVGVLVRLQGFQPRWSPTPQWFVHAERAGWRCGPCRSLSRCDCKRSSPIWSPTPQRLCRQKWLEGSVDLAVFHKMLYKGSHQMCSPIQRGSLVLLEPNVEWALLFLEELVGLPLGVITYTAVIWGAIRARWQCGHRSFFIMMLRMGLPTGGARKWQFSCTPKVPCG